jgi:hypothetical protein
MSQDQGNKFVPPEPSREYDPMPAEPPLNENEETHRRLLKTKTSFDAPTNIAPIPLRNDNHALILVNVTHQNHRPRSIYPGFRILGAFPDAQSVSEHVAIYYQASECSMYVTPAHQLMSICNGTEQQADLEYNRNHIDNLVKIHNTAAENRDEDFKNNVQDRKTGDLGKSVFAKQHKNQKTPSAVNKIFEKTIQGLKKTSTLSSSACIAKQNFAAVIILTDIGSAALEGEKKKEPLLAVLDVFGTEEDATNYAKYTASKQYPKCAIDIVDMYGWCFPENIDPDEIKEVYGSDQLNDIMQGRKDNMNITDKFEEWCKENNVEPQITEIGEEVTTTIDEQMAAKGSITFT